MFQFNSDKKKKVTVRIICQGSSCGFCLLVKVQIKAFVLGFCSSAAIHHHRSAASRQISAPDRFCQRPIFSQLSGNSKPIQSVPETSRQNIVSFISTVAVSKSSSSSETHLLCESVLFKTMRTEHVKPTQRDVELSDSGSFSSSGAMFALESLGCQRGAIHSRV